MKVNIWNKMIEGSNGTIVMESGDHLSIGYADHKNNFQTITIQLRGTTCLIEHEQTQDVVIIRSSKTHYVKG